MFLISISVSIKKKLEDECVVVYFYEKNGSDKGEFLINKHNLEVVHLSRTNDNIDNIMYLSAAAKIVKLIKKGESLPEITSYNS